VACVVNESYSDTGFRIIGVDVIKVLNSVCKM
jgi:hypothetical protein